jgi:UDPglucose--hexose-1-phosphate uridylyltransferase
VTLRRDPVSGRLVAIAPGRAGRPGAGHALIEPATQDELDRCPFCAGREDRTPPETLRLGAGPTGWRVRVVPNLYPALERQEVVVHSPEHKRSFAELSDEEVELVEQAWLERGRAGFPEGFSYPFPLINEGRAAGSSLPHSHSQIAFLREPPPAVRGLDPGAAQEILDRAELVVAEEGVDVALVHPAGRLPYELLIGGSDYLGDQLRLLRTCIRKLQALEGPVPWNAWLYDLFQGEQHLAYLQVVPRLTALAGLELGAGIYVNSLEPTEAAARLRSQRGPAAPDSL